MRVMSQVYLSKEDRAQGRGIDLRVVKRVETHYFFETSDVRKRVDHVISRVFLCLFVHFKLSLASPMILLYSK